MQWYQVPIDPPVVLSCTTLLHDSLLQNAVVPIADWPPWLCTTLLHDSLWENAVVPSVHYYYGKKLWQCWYVIKVVILIMISLGWLFQKDSWIKSAHNTRREKTICVTLLWRSHTYKMDTTGMINFWNNTIHLFRYEKFYMHNRITVWKLQHVPRRWVTMRKDRTTYI